MIKHYLLFANWREKDVNFLNSLNLERVVEKGYFGIPIKDGFVKEQILEYYSKKDSLFKKTKPPAFSFAFQGVTFSKEELDCAKYYTFLSLGGDSPPKRWPQPNDNQEYLNQVFDGDRYIDGLTTRIANKNQKTSFRIKKPKWGKKEVCFNLGIEFEYLCFKKDFFEEVLAPLGLQSKVVINHSTGTPLEDTVQLIMPTAKSKLLLENSAYDIHPKHETGGYKQYAVQTLDFFPPFENDFDFHICYSQEDFFIGHKRIIISKEFCSVLVKHKIIKYDTNNLTPLLSD